MKYKKGFRRNVRGIKVQLLHSLISHNTYSTYLSLFCQEINSFTWISPSSNYSFINTFMPTITHEHTKMLNHTQFTKFLLRMNIVFFLLSFFKGAPIYIHLYLILFASFSCLLRCKPEVIPHTNTKSSHTNTQSLLYTRK